MATTLLLARHGQTDANVARQWQGQNQTPLNDTGREQARALAAELADEQIDAIYCSDLDRTRETAEIIGAALDLPVQPDPRLREVDVGDLAGRSIAELGDWPRPLDYLLAERPDIFDEMRHRVIAALRELALEHDGERLLIVTHGGPIAAAWFACGGSVDERPTVANCHVVPIRVEAGKMSRVD